MAKRSTNSLDTVITTTEGWFAMFPALPKEWKNFLVMITPWVALICGILGVLESLSALGNSQSSSYMMGVQYSGLFMVSLVLVLVASGFEVAAFPGTNKRKISGWKLLYWSVLIYFIAQLVTFNIVWGFIVVIIEMYLLFQIKSYYK